MRRVALGFTVLGVLIAPLAQAAVHSAGPALRVLDKAPLVLRGTGFVPAERVKVTVVTPDAELVRRTRASRFGRFVVRFDTVVDACYGAQRATAVGRRGSEVSIVLERPWERECTEFSLPVDLKPSLRVLSLVPFSVRGTHFRPSERVAVTLRGTWVERVRASAGGTFVATFRGVEVNRCNGYVVKAVGSKGSSARLRAPELMCESTNPG